MMSTPVLVFLDWFFIIFHTLFTLFNMVGWIWKKTRLIHLVTIGLTALSWFVLGIWYGWGYCFCTDWHWQVREMLGKPVGSRSYIGFLIHEFTGFSPDPGTVDTITLSVFLVCVSLSVILFIRDKVGKRK
jgi:hypothetical protein